MSHKPNFFPTAIPDSEFGLPNDATVIKRTASILGGLVGSLFVLNEPLKPYNRITRSNKMPYTPVSHFKLLIPEPRPNPYPEIDLVAFADEMDKIAPIDEMLDKIDALKLQHVTGNAFEGQFKRALLEAIDDSTFYPTCQPDIPIAEIVVPASTLELDTSQVLEAVPKIIR